MKLLLLIFIAALALPIGLLIGLIFGAVLFFAIWIDGVFRYVINAD
jgi:ABC-type sugar transport system permease subunit